MLLHALHRGLRYVNGKEAFVVQEGTCISACLLRQETIWRTVGCNPYLAAAYLFLQHGAVLLHNAGLNKHDAVDQSLMTLLVCNVNRNITADGIQILAGRHLVLEGKQIPPLSENSLSP